MMRRFSLPLICLLIAAAVTPAAGAGYRTAVGGGADETPVVVVSGTPYEMGYSYGKLMAAEVRGCMERYLAAAKAEDAARYSDAALDAAWATVAPHVPSRFIEEMRGVAAGAGVPYALIRRGHCVSLLEGLACSALAVWGDATANGRLYQIRNLDYTTDAGLQDYPAIVVYIPETGIAHANVAFAGFVGSLAGLNARGLALSEIGAWAMPVSLGDLDGVPFFVMFRDLLYDASNLDQALDAVRRARRIKEYIYLIGDGRRRAAALIWAARVDIRVWSEGDVINPATVPRAGVLYSTQDDRAADQHMRANYGSYNPQLAIALSRLVAGGQGNLMNVVYDASGRQMWVAYAEGATPAYERDYVHFRLSDYVRRPPRGSSLGQEKGSRAVN
ncbi:MAG: hypothetical protein JSV65_15720 [Armatimonadota bacterium]|nr:MAG: hypothetical protein JSV65_15720 [Armatimonadota bacterium]